MHRESKISVGSIVFLVWILVTSCENQQYLWRYYRRNLNKDEKMQEVLLQQNGTKKTVTAKDHKRIFRRT